MSVCRRSGMIVVPFSADLQHVPCIGLAKFRPAPFRFGPNSVDSELGPRAKFGRCRPNFAMLVDLGPNLVNTDPNSIQLV